MGWPTPLIAAAVASVLLHLALAAWVAHGLRLGRVVPQPSAMGAVELLMVEKKGSGEPQPAPAASLSAPAEQPAESPPTPRKEQDDPAPSGRPIPASADTGEAVPVPAPAPAKEAAADEAVTPAPEQEAKPAEQPQPPAPSAQKQAALTFNLGGTDSLSDAEVSGDRVIPASPDDRYRNRPPVYPRESVARGDRGAVILIIHVSERGVSTGADVAQSSGHAALDRAALEAVRSWRFRPALKDGKAVPFDMPMRFIFEAD
ncbi:MAG: energy transducer TonB [Proteobacteria bacterium]|nr:energy transducer TonB [Pseudomonadota bacterium]